METRDGFNVGSSPVADAVGKRLSAGGKRIGRPPGSKTGKPVAAVASGSVSQDSLDRERKDCAPFVEMAMLVFVSGDEFLKRSIVIRLRTIIGNDDAKLKEFEVEVFARYQVTEADKTYLRGVLMALAIKYPILRKIGPEISLVVFLVRYGAQHFQLLRAVESLRPKQPVPRKDPKPEPVASAN